MSAGPTSETKSYDLLTVPSFDRVAVEVIPGAGLVARTPGAILVLSQPADDELWRAAEALIAQLADISRSASRAPGLPVSQALQAWHDARPTVSLALLAATDDGLALCLSGAAQAGLPQTGHRLAAQDEGGWMNRQLPWTDAAIVLTLAETTAVNAPTEHAVFDLHSGVVPGAGVRLAAHSAAQAGPAASVQRLDQLPPPPPPPAVEEPSAEAAPPLSLPPQAKAAVLFDADDAPPPRAPLPVVEAAPLAGDAGPAAAHPADHAHTAEPSAPVASREMPAEDGVVVDGFLCSRGHLNDPRGHFCAQCGIRMAELTGIITQGRRPPLGLLLFDNGATFVLDHDYLIGREPEPDPEVRSGELRPLVLIDQSGGISRRHAEIRLRGWDVVLIDRGSANGTLVALRDADQWRAVVPGQPVQLLPGMRVSMGRRTLSFETPHRTT